MEKYNVDDLIIVKQGDPDYVDQMYRDFRELDNLILETAKLEEDEDPNITEVIFLATKRANKEIELKSRHGLPMFDSVPLEHFHASFDKILLEYKY